MDTDKFIKDLQKAKAKLVWMTNHLEPGTNEHRDCMNHISKLDCELLATALNKMEDISNYS